MKKKLFAVIAALALLALPVIGLASTAHAEGVKTGGSVVIEDDETIDRTLFVSGNTVDIAGTVDGDVFCAGQSVTITGTVRGDVICAGQNVRIAGTVEGDVRLAGQVVTLSGDVDGNATIVAQTFVTDESSVVRDLSVAASVVTLNGEVERDAYIGADTATVNGLVGRDVQASVESLTLGSNARINGDVAYTSDSEADRREGAQIAGQLTQLEPPSDDDGLNAGQVLGGIMFALLILLVVSMALAALFPRALQQVTNNGVQHPGRTILTGLATVLLTPLLILVLTVSIIGSLLGLLLFLVFMLVLFLSGPMFGYYVGRMLLYKTTGNPLLYMLLGSSIVGLLYFVPYVGGLVLLVAASMGSGMIVSELISRRVRPVYAVEAKPKAKRK